ncbi:MAG TPA: cytochrome c [Candidatus Methylomirabilis sp.]|nr:cytochrome c [Candidatus Methylomirabilis sp.]
MRRRFPILGLILILIGAAGLLWLHSFPGPPWAGSGWGRGPWGRGGFFMGPGMGPGMMGGWWPGWSGKQKFASNGEQIYYTGVSARTGPIPRSGGPMWVAYGEVGCVACHGTQGRGGVPVMMGTATPEDIRYPVLTKAEAPEKGKEEMEHPPYTDALIQRAVTQGVDPAGKPLDWTMPRWQMSDADFSDLLAYLKTLR